MKCVASRHYNVDIGGHVFPTVKYGLVKKRLIEKHGFSEADFIEAQPAGDEQVLLVHTREYFEKIKSVLAKESPTQEELEDAKNKFAAIEQIRNEYIEAVWGLKGPEEEEKAHSGKISSGKGGKDEIILIAPSEFFEVRAKLESR